MRDYRDSDYLAGITDGEGCLLVDVRRAKRKGAGYVAIHIIYKVTLRDDDARILELLRNTFGGSLSGHTDKRPNHQSTMVWSVTAKRDILSLIKYFDAHPLVVKLEQYNVWREAAMLYYRHTVPGGRSAGNPDWLIEAMRAYKKKLEGLKKYIKLHQDIEVDFEDAQETFDY